MFSQVGTMLLCSLAVADAFMGGAAFASHGLLKHSAIASLRKAGRAQGLSLAGVRMQGEEMSEEEQIAWKRMLASKDLDTVFKNNKRWVTDRTRNDEEFFARMASGQSPKFLWIGCSDAKVPANEIVGCGPGELFVHRNYANLVVNNDLSIQSIFQFAVEYLKVEHIIVCGHYNCGGVAAALSKQDIGPPLDEWVRHVRDVYRLHKDELDAIADPSDREKRVVELNVLEQSINVLKTAVVQRRRIYTHLKEGAAIPMVHPVVFDSATGELKKLDWTTDSNLDELRQQFELDGLEASSQGWADSDEYPIRPNTVRDRSMFNRLPPGMGRK